MEFIDYEGIFKFKLIVPFLYIISWAYFILCPIYFRGIYHNINCAIISYLLLRSIYGLIIHIMVGYRTIKTLSETDKLDYLKINNEQKSDFYHAFIIPNYKQDLALLADTIRILSSHSRAKESYLIFLAMEAHEENSTNKALELIDSFQNSFRLIDYTSHVMSPNEVKDKASNQNWCARKLVSVFDKNKIKKDKVIVTIIDADSWAPPLYIDKVQQYLKTNKENTHKVIFVPPQIYARNHLDVPVISRVFEQFACFLLNFNSISSIGMPMPFSNYSISYCLLEEVGFWDTCEDAMSQDCHLTFKANWKTHGNVENIAIYAAFNQVCLQTGNGYLADCQAKYLQMLRLSLSVVNIAYNINMSFKSKWVSLKSFIMTISPLESMSLSALLPLIALSLKLQGLFLDKSQKTKEFNLTTKLMLAVGLLQFLSLILYEMWKRYVKTNLYKIENDSWFRILEMIIFSQFIIIFLYPILVISAFRSLITGKEYIVSQKHLENHLP